MLATNNQNSLANQIYAFRNGKVEPETVEDKALEAATARATQIIMSKEAIGREAMAKELAKAPNITAEDAIGILKTANGKNSTKRRTSSESIYLSRKAIANG